MPGTPQSKELQPGGDSDSWIKGEANFVRLGNEFLAHLKDEELKKKWGSVWESIPEETVGKSLMGHVGDFLASVYKIPAGHKHAGRHLMHGPAVGAWSGLLNTLKRRFAKSTSPETRVRCFVRPARTRSDRTAACCLLPAINARS